MRILKLAPLAAGSGCPRASGHRARRHPELPNPVGQHRLHAGQHRCRLRYQRVHLHPAPAAGVRPTHRLGQPLRAPTRPTGCHPLPRGHVAGARRADPRLRPEHFGGHPQLHQRAVRREVHRQQQRALLPGFPGRIQTGLATPLSASRHRIALFPKCQTETVRFCVCSRPTLFTRSGQLPTARSASASRTPRSLG